MPTGHPFFLTKETGRPPKRLDLSPDLCHTDFLNDRSEIPAGADSVVRSICG